MLLNSLLSARAASAVGDQDEIITPDIQAVIDSFYYIIVDASPKKLLDNSGLSEALNTGMPGEIEDNRRSASFPNSAGAHYFRLVLP